MNVVQIAVDQENIELIKCLDFLILKRIEREKILSEILVEIYMNKFNDYLYQEELDIRLLLS